MSNRRENLKKSLGITEYPWSSDEDEINPPVAPSMPEATSQTLPEMHFLHWTSNAPRPSSGTMPGTSGQSSTPPRTRLPPPPPPPPPTVSSSSTRPTTCAERDLFWSIINNNPRRTTTINVSRMSSSDIASLTRHTPASELREATVDRSSSAADIQRIMAIKKLTRTYNQRPNPTLNVIVPRNGAMSSSLRNLLSQSRAKELIAKIKATRAKRPHSETTNTADNDLGHSDSRIPVRSGPSLMSIDEADEAQPSTSGLSQPAPAQAELDRVDAPVPSANVNADQSDEEEEIFTKITENAEGRNSAAEVSLEEIVEIDAEPSGGQDENHNTKPQPTANAETVENTTPAEEQPHGVKRKFGDEAAEPTIREFNQSLLRLLECPVCMEWLEPPMSQCRRGHLVCARCRARLSACPVCRTAFSSVRNRAMEAVAEMLRYPCKHGCGSELRLRRRATHEASCAARLYPCPAPACAARPLPLPLLAPHVRSKHLSMVKIGRKHKLSMKVNSEQHSAWVVLALQQLFHLRVDVDIRTWAIVIYVAYVGPQRNARNYSYEVSVVGQHNSRKLMYTRATHSDLESSTLNVSRQDCFHLTLDQAMNFLRLKNRHCVPDKFLDFHVEIRKCEVDNKDDSDSWFDGS